MDNRTIYESQTTKFEVKAGGNPKPESKWLKNGNPIRSSERYKIAQIGEVVALSVSKSKEEDSGVYTCVLSNKLGNAETEANLVVLPIAELKRPKFVDHPEDGNVNAGQPSSFKAVVIGEPVPDITWQVYQKFFFN